MFNWQEIKHLVEMNSDSGRSHTGFQNVSFCNCALWFNLNELISSNIYINRHAYLTCSVCVCVYRGMSRPECDSHPWTRRLSNTKRQPDTVLSGISKEEEQQCPHSALVLLSTSCSNSPSPSLTLTPLTSCTRALSVSNSEDGYKENENVWKLHPSLPPTKVSPA